MTRSDRLRRVVGIAAQAFIDDLRRASLDEKRRRGDVIDMQEGPDGVWRASL